MGNEPAPPFAGAACGGTDGGTTCNEALPISHASLHTIHDTRNSKPKVGSASGEGPSTGTSQLHAPSCTNSTSSSCFSTVGLGQIGVPNFQPSGSVALATGGPPLSPGLVQYMCQPGCTVKFTSNAARPSGRRHHCAPCIFTGFTSGSPAGTSISVTASNQVMQNCIMTRDVTALTCDRNRGRRACRPSRSWRTTDRSNPSAEPVPAAEAWTHPRAHRARPPTEVACDRCACPAACGRRARGADWCRAWWDGR